MSYFSTLSPGTGWVQGRSRTLHSTLQSPQTECFRFRTLKFCQYQPKTYTDQQKKPQSAATLRDDAIIIFKLVMFCFSPSEFSRFGAAHHKAPQTDSLSFRMLNFRQYQHKTHTDKQKKPQGAATIMNDAILILKQVNFCFSKSEIRTYRRCCTLQNKASQTEISCLRTLKFYFVFTNTRHTQTNRKSAVRCNFQGRCNYNFNTDQFLGRVL
jgi:hypothetical protein